MRSWLTRLAVVLLTIGVTNAALVAGCSNANDQVMQGRTHCPHAPCHSKSCCATSFVVFQATAPKLHSQRGPADCGAISSLLSGGTRPFPTHHLLRIGGGNSISHQPDDLLVQIQVWRI